MTKKGGFVAEVFVIGGVCCGEGARGLSAYLQYWSAISCRWHQAPLDW